MIRVIKDKLKEAGRKALKYIEVDYYNEVIISAARHGNLENLLLSISRGANVNITHKDILDSQGLRALHYAAMNGHTDIVVALLKRRAAINATDMMDWTPLHFAVSHERAGVVAVLLENGADITAMNRQGRTAFGIAIRHNLKDIVRIFLQHNVGLMDWDNDWVASMLPYLDSEQLNALQPNEIDILCPHPSQVDYWITTVAELNALSPADKLAIAYRWPHGASRSDLISDDIKAFTKNALQVPFERRLTRLSAECVALFGKLKQLFEDKPDLRIETLKEKPEYYNSMFFAFDIYKDTPSHIQLKICTKITGANQEPTEDEINQAMSRLKLPAA